MANLKEENNKLKTVLHHIKQENKSKKNQINRNPGEILEKTSNEKSSNINLAQDNVEAENVTREREERPLIIVAGDSIVKGLKGWLMSRRANVESIFFLWFYYYRHGTNYFIKPLINKQPRQIILHIATNDLLRSSPLEVTAAIKKLTEIIICAMEFSVLYPKLPTVMTTYGERPKK